MHGLTCAKCSLRTSRESIVDLFALGSGCFARESSASAICYWRVYCAEHEDTSAKQRRNATYLSACQATLHGKAVPRQIRWHHRRRGGARGSSRRENEAGKTEM